MSEVHPEIVRKLERYPASVQELARKAVELASTSSDAAVFDALKNWTRELIRREASGR